MEKYCTAGQPTDDSMAMRIARWVILKICNTYYLLLFHRKNGFTNAPQCYGIRTLPVFFDVGIVHFAVCSMEGLWEEQRNLNLLKPTSHVMHQQFNP